MVVGGHTPMYLLLDTGTYIFYLLGTQHHTMDLALRNLSNCAD